MLSLHFIPTKGLQFKTMPILSVVPCCPASPLTTPDSSLLDILKPEKSL